MLTKITLVPLDGLQVQLLVGRRQVIGWISYIVDSLASE